MNIFKHLIIIFLSILLIACGTNNGQNKGGFILKTNSKNNTFSNNETLSISLENPKNQTIDSIVFKLDNKTIGESSSLIDFKLGKQTIEAVVYFNNEHQSVFQNIIILNNETPKIFTYKIINEYPHDITSYTQGLEFYNDTLYESTGQYKESKLRKVDYKTGSILKNIDLADEYFGEGLTILNNKIYQLTWQKGIGFIYDLNSFEKTNSFKYGKSKEGWGLCNNGNVIYKSDGSEDLWILNPETMIEQEYIQVYTNKGPIKEINELEWINGKIYANRYQKDGVAIINPINGAVIGVIDFSPLKKLVKQHQGLDVLNGIAYNPKTKTVFVTGKRWDKLFEIEIIE
ncbi:glutaminyl-peptide cyclotransferase [Gaetbulibacter aquiaggeris]|uniref:Glutaminyl-peptide cyclotransferase n=1 Tax=Gaetbulibacter aquiaggeris TaxID=1735373 RepID=A0ABW7MQM3_9FLAO